jgi:hypothetical protein
MLKKRKQSTKIEMTSVIEVKEGGGRGKRSRG